MTGPDHTATPAPASDSPAWFETTLSDLGDTITTPVPTPAWWIVATSAAFALLVLLSPRSLSVVSVVSTIVHETGHAVVASVTGGRTDYVTITNRHEGVTRSSSPDGIARFVKTAAGYSAPPIAGAGAAWIIAQGHAPTVLALAALVMLLLLVTVSRDAATVLTLTITGAVFLLLLVAGTVLLQTWAACALAWVLVTNEARSLVSLVQSRIAGDTLSDDASSLAEQTFIPGIVWIAGWFVLIGFSVVTTSGLLAA